MSVARHETGMPGQWMAKFASRLQWLRARTRSRLVRDAAWSFVLKFSSTTLSFLIAVLLARTLGARDYGYYTYAFSLVMFLSLPAQAGLPNLVIRETAKGIAQNRPGLVRGVWIWSGRISLLVSLAVAFLAAVILLVRRGSGSETFEATLAWALVLVPLVALSSLRSAALRGLHKIVAGQLPDSIIRPGLLFLSLIGVLLVARKELNASEAMAIHVLAAFAAFGAGSLLLWRNTPHAVREAKPSFRSQAWLASTLPLALMAGMQMVNSQADILMLGLFKTADQVGIYRVAVQMATLASFGLQAVNMVVAPRFAALYANDRLAELQRLVTISARIVLAFNLAVSLFFIVLGQPFLGLVFGKAFVASFSPLLILLGGQLVNSAAGSVGFLLNMTGHERETARGMAVAAAANIVLNLLLIPRWGTAGAAAATAVSLAMWNVLLFWAARERLGITSLAFYFGARRSL